MRLFKKSPFIFVKSLLTTTVFLFVWFVFSAYMFGITAFLAEQTPFLHLENSNFTFNYLLSLWGVNVSYGFFNLFGAIDSLVALLVLAFLLKLWSMIPWIHVGIVVLKFLLKILYGVHVKGLQHYHEAGERVLIVANHVSFLDAVLLGLFLPEKPAFAIATTWYKHPIVRMVASEFDLFPINTENSLALKTLIKQLKTNKKVVIFPEGRLTATGKLMKVYEGSGLIAEKSQANILPIHIGGAENTSFSRVGKFSGIRFPRITLTIFPSKRIQVPQGLAAAEKREYISQEIHDTMREMAFHGHNAEQTLTDLFVSSFKIYGRKKIVMNDAIGMKLTFSKLMFMSTLLGQKISLRTKKKEHVGIFLPNLSITAVVFWALQFFMRVPVMLNYSAGKGNVVASCSLASVKTIITSKKFVRQKKLKETIQKLQLKHNIIYVEDMKRSIKLFDIIYASVMNILPIRMLFKGRDVRMDSPAVIFFQPGFETAPQGVVLSHKNILTNYNQINTVMPFKSDDICLSAMPMFHSMGLVIGSILPLMNGIEVFYYPSPLHYKYIPEICYLKNITILISSDTFLNKYEHHAHNYDFYSVRYVFAGGERLKKSTREAWINRFGIRIYEGYGVTSVSPLLSVNTPLEFKQGTVGRFLPGMQYLLKKTSKSEKGGQLYVKGLNMAMANLKSKKVGIDKFPKDHWYNTGDIVDVDSEGYVTILGRSKRFAKIGGTTVSLVEVEDFIQDVYKKDRHVVVSVPDKRKGEKLILFTTFKEASLHVIRKIFRKEGWALPYAPREVVVLDDIPQDDAGKIDYTALRALYTQRKKDV